MIQVNKPERIAVQFFRFAKEHLSAVGADHPSGAVPMAQASSALRPSVAQMSSLLAKGVIYLQMG
jgi:hypothetical protein